MHGADPQPHDVEKAAMKHLRREGVPASEHCDIVWHLPCHHGPGVELGSIGKNESVRIVSLRNNKA